MLRAAAEGGFELAQEIIEQVDNNVGVQLMRMMGHVPGTAIGKKKGRDEASIAGSALLSLKRSKYSAFGLGYDSTINALEFKHEERKQPMAAEDNEKKPKGGNYKQF
jgi:hypothetical protein